MADDTDDDPMADLLTVDEAAAVMRCGRSTAYRMIDEGELPTVWHRARHWISRQAIRDYFESQRQEGAQRANKRAAARGRKPRRPTTRAGRAARATARRHQSGEDEADDSHADVA